MSLHTTEHGEDAQVRDEERADAQCDPALDLAETRLDPGVAACYASDGAGGERLAACIPGATRSQEERHLDAVLGAKLRHLRDLAHP